ncbi:MAG: hypothetical protein PWP07_196 [Epulopiscium sp.]|jgi:uncharacterized membrane protein required for colicin V production|uniref:CvpA family protein n=1 Tax=Defluviitalea raffinosedens TaxID=1450156 RepID=A0A7C8LJ34_9FIRM|nr:CvpA family protein [Defluviitalea raffinosedens]MBZ4668763.1 colicin production protein [Defluviitaleaceae bacterium]MDK2786971.1 hypothetical protein [Candidatus Epulonipiscium sp.]KAE9627757.1 hypothetical protein GND95_14565 [Defluviitalea raffinosedens]MBM7685998.1 putative membrane protein required for colicin V production [Defluviitalea raffinosedens]HHW67756.1 CvpA family protein [Candidatus Epulonipiscium sp.]
MNVADILVLAFFVVNGWIAYKRGLVLSLFKLISSIASMILSYTLYPIVSAYLRTSTSLFDKMKTQIAPTILVPEGTKINTLEGQVNFINDLNVPKFLKGVLVENNNSEIYSIFQVDSLKDYIAGYIANICINIISMVIVFFVVSVGLRILIGIMDILSKLPVINSVNRLFGLIFGFASGVLKIWVFFIVLFIFQSNPAFEKIFLLLENSTYAKYLYEYNYLLKFVGGLFL